MIDLNIDHFNKELNYIKRPNQKEIIRYLRFKKNTKGMNSRLSGSEEHINCLEGKVMEIIWSEQQNKIQILKNVRSLRNLWETIKCANIHIIDVAEEEEREENGKCIWRNYAWKQPKPEEENRYAGIESTEGPKQDKPKQTHTKIYHNYTGSN